MLGALAGCSSLGSDKDEGVDKRSAEEIYAEAREQMDSGSYENAAKTFEKLEAKFPYGRYAQQAQLEIAYAYYKAGDPASAGTAIDRFIKLHPNHPNVDYAYYLKGLISFNENTGLFSVIGQQDMTERDPKAAQDSFDAFKELITRFPDSRYAEDAHTRMGYLLNALAQHQIHVARYYIRRGAYLAAANRAQTVIKNFPNSPTVEEALGVMAYSYRQLRMNDLADDAQRVLQQNFPNSPYIAEAGMYVRPWWKIW
ncbi:MAG: outer membrane protein assembly factor BamD [Betaproteobacteria bacterium]|nr:outer membrane protein assembly factor BamD [Betaproteobacteria bacterium]